eukprot:scaffold81220_cov82-Cyclotella_meneghiniana.AAC.1
MRVDMRVVPRCAKIVDTVTTVPLHQTVACKIIANVYDYKALITPAVVLQSWLRQHGGVDRLARDDG